MPSLDLRYDIQEIHKKLLVAKVSKFVSKNECVCVLVGFSYFDVPLFLVHYFRGCTPASLLCCDFEID